MGTNVFFRHPNHTIIDLSRPSLVSFGSNIDINDNFTILTHDFSTFVFRGLYHDFVPSSGKVVIGNNVVFGMNVTILKGVTIGDNCIIGLGSVITKDIPSNSVATGAPAKVVCSIHDYYLRRKQQSVIESFDYVSSIIESKKRKPIITDFTEEWALFFRQSDFDTYPEMHSIIDWRLKDSAKEYWEIHRPLFDGFDDFMNEFEKYDNNKTKI